jgi:arginyl-tRNA synthetase
MTLESTIPGNHIRTLISDALEEAMRSGALPQVETPPVSVERPQKIENGDFASSTPLKLAKPMRMNPLQIAEKLAELIPVGGQVERVWTAKPGFVNIALSPEWLASRVDLIRDANDTYGNIGIGDGKRVQVEFVSVNPTGPVHVGHARGAVVGSALAKILEAAGYSVEREYYLNDSGNQMGHFHKTLLARYKQANGVAAEVHAEGYQGDYMVDLAREISDQEGRRFLDMDDAEAEAELGEIGLQRMVDEIRTDMSALRVDYDSWFSERSLFTNGQFDAAMKLLKDQGYVAEKDGATWFTSSALGDDDDKVIIRSTGVPTYFATDVAYHYDKFKNRGFDRVIDIFGADHQGHARFFKAMKPALGIADDQLELLLYQLVTLKRGDEVVRLSKRTGDLITLRELIEEVGADACRFVFLSRSVDSQMDFDLELAKEESAENPVYYVQYAHARIASILRLATERGIDFTDGDTSLLDHESELALIRKMLVLPETVEFMALNLEPQHLPHYAIELATSFHTFYQQRRVVSSKPEDLEVTRARLKLVDAARTVLARCLDLMLMEAPDKM